jgi:hypothetical protein
LFPTGRDEVAIGSYVHDHDRYDERALIELVASRQFTWQFRWRRPDFESYLDCRKLTLSRGNQPDRRVEWDRFRHDVPLRWAECGGAVPIVASILCFLVAPRFMCGFFVRREAKDHGTGKRIEGSSNRTKPQSS